MHAVQESKAPQTAKDDYINQFFTWRELSINFVHFNPLYDSIECAPDWAHKTLAAHARDPRPILYTREQFESADTHDELWNAAQLQMLHAGWMHNYMRMYWAKKILEWSPSPAVAWQTALYLNDKYFLDGRDPDGYAGVAWAMGGKFDRPWFERPIFGTIRWMSGDAARKKFDADKYIRQMNDPLGWAVMRRMNKSLAVARCSAHQLLSSCLSELAEADLPLACRRIRWCSAKMTWLGSDSRSLPRHPQADQEHAAPQHKPGHTHPHRDAPVLRPPQSRKRQWRANRPMKPRSQQPDEPDQRCGSAKHQARNDENDTEAKHAVITLPLPSK